MRLILASTFRICHQQTKKSPPPDGGEESRGTSRRSNRSTAKCIKCHIHSIQGENLIVPLILLQEIPHMHPAGRTPTGDTSRYLSPVSTYPIRRPARMPNLPLFLDSPLQFIANTAEGNKHYPEVQHVGCVKPASDLGYYTGRTAATDPANNSDGRVGKKNDADRPNHWFLPPSLQFSDEDSPADKSERDMGRQASAACLLQRGLHGILNQIILNVILNVGLETCWLWNT